MPAEDGPGARPSFGARSGGRAPSRPGARPKALLFDLDGTVLDTNALIVESFQHTLGELLGISITAEELYPYFGEPLRDTMARFSRDRADEMVTHYRTYNIANHDRLTRLFPGLDEVLPALREGGLRLAIVTSKYESTARRGLDLFSLTPLFEVVVGLDATVRHKPDPDPALKALEALDVAPEDAVMVGDSVLDVQCGRRAGTGTAAVGWSVFPREQLVAERPDYWIDEPRDLLVFCDGRSPQGGGRNVLPERLENPGRER